MATKERLPHAVHVSARPAHQEAPRIRKPVHQEDRMTVSRNQPDTRHLETSRPNQSQRPDPSETLGRPEAAAHIIPPSQHDQPRRIDRLPQTAQAVSEPRVDPSHPPGELPPTLFALPDLNAPSTRPIDAATTDAGQASAASTADEVPQANPEPHSTAPSVAPSSEPIIRNDPPSAQAVPPQHDRSPIDGELTTGTHVHEQEASASLLDRVGSHAIVLVMLLVVFGIALLAGRSPIDHSPSPLATESTIADPVIATSEVNMPEPANSAIPPGVDSPASVDASESAFFAAASTSKVNTSTTSSGHSVGPPESGTVASPASTRSFGMPNDTASDLPADQTDLSTASGAADGTPTSMMESPGYQPSVEDSAVTGANVDASTKPPSSAMEPSTGHRYSRTPRRIADWSRYFPVDATYVAPTSATVGRP